MSSAALSAISDDYQFRLHSTSYFSPAAAYQHVDLATHTEFGQIHTRFDRKAAIRQNAAFVANFVLWSDTSYFDAAAETKSLAHTP